MCTVQKMTQIYTVYYAGDIGFVISPNQCEL